MPANDTSSIYRAAQATDRISAARDFLAAVRRDSEALVIANNPAAADDLVRALALERGATLGIHRLTLDQLIFTLATAQMAGLSVLPATVSSTVAIAARAVFNLKARGEASYFDSVVNYPGFAEALAATRHELSLNRLGPSELDRLDGAGPSLAAILRQFDRELADARLIDRATLIDHAIAAVRAPCAAHLAAIPTVLLDVPLEHLCERDFVAALAARAPCFLATVAAGDDRSRDLLAQALTVDSAALGAPPAAAPDASSLVRLQQFLFAEAALPERPLDDTVAVFSAAGEMQECVEIARRIQAEAKAGIAFDRIAIVLHGPSQYASYLEEALDRAGVPAYFARGAARPEPGGRALLALLACAAENLSARRFAEYLSLAQTPDAAAASARDLDDRDSQLDDAVDHAARAPWRWEKLLVEAAVIGSRDRWDRRLAGLEAELRLRRDALDRDDDAQAAALDRQIADLGHLRDLAMPTIDALAALPGHATWAQWLAYLRALTTLAIHDRDAILSELADLDLLGPIGPVTLDEVRLALADRLGRLSAPPRRRRYGAVYVAPAELIRGMDFDVTMVPGLVERVFPKKLVEDPILPDAARRRLSPALPLQAERVADERLALRLAVGAATRRTVLSYPRVDLDQGRPRVPSFYALEIFRAAEGRLPGFDELARRAAGDRPARLGWPAPERAADAIDDAEFDLAVLDQIVDADPATTVGAAHYLLAANPHLGRALRARARRWLRLWTRNDGLVEPDPAEREALDRHQLAARSYSPTALQNFAACPYRFFLQAIQRLSPREEIEHIEVIDPLTRGALFHEVQFEFLTALRDADRLPVTPETLADGHTALEATLSAVAARYHDQLAPAIERVWLDGIDAIRADLREWLRRSAADSARWRPEHFELGFGLSDRSQADPRSVADPVELKFGPELVLKLRGSIDLVERGAARSLRVTDHKTGRVRTNRDVTIGGGKTLQPVLYALAAERVLGEPIAAGRLYYCTSAGGYEERVVTIDDAARKAIADFTEIFGEALEEGFLPAAPGDTRECEYCDYRRVCGPYEHIRVKYKTSEDIKSAAKSEASRRLDNLRRLRGMR